MTTEEILLRLRMDSSTLSQDAATAGEKVKTFSETVAHAFEHAGSPGRAIHKMLEQIKDISPLAGVALEAAFTPVGALMLGVGAAIGVAHKALEDFNKKLEDTVRRAGERAGFDPQEAKRKVAETLEEVKRAEDEYERQQKNQETDPTKSALEKRKSEIDREAQYAAKVRDREHADALKLIEKEFTTRRQKLDDEHEQEKRNLEDRVRARELLIERTVPPHLRGIASSRLATDRISAERDIEDRYKKSSRELDLEHTARTNSATDRARKQQDTAEMTKFGETQSALQAAQADIEAKRSAAQGKRKLLDDAQKAQARQFGGLDVASDSRLKFQEDQIKELDKLIEAEKLKSFNQGSLGGDIGRGILDVLAAPTGIHTSDQGPPNQARLIQLENQRRQILSGIQKERDRVSLRGEQRKNLAADLKAAQETETKFSSLGREISDAIKSSATPVQIVAVSDNI